MGRKSLIFANCMIRGVPFRITGSKKEKDGNGKRMVSMMTPEGKPLHDKTASVRVRAGSKDDEKVLKAAGKIITEHRELVIEWLKAGLLPEATPPLLLLVLPEESLGKVYGRGAARKLLLERAVEALPPLTQMEEKAETETLRVVEKTADGYDEKKTLRSALNRLFNEMVYNKIWKENPVSKALAVKRSTKEKADRSLRQRALSLEEMRRLAQICLSKMKSDARYAVVLLQLTTGISAGEACALKVNDILCYNDVIFIEICAKLKQKRYKVTEWEPYDRDSGRVRRVACTPLAQAALRALLEPRLEAEAAAGAPLIVDENGKRMEVLAYRAFVKKVLDKVMPECAEMTKTDLVRITFEVHCRTLCGMTADCVRRLMGLKAEQTYEAWYADYEARLALLAIEMQLRRGQHKIWNHDEK